MLLEALHKTFLFQRPSIHHDSRPPSRLDYTDAPTLVRPQPDTGAFYLSNATVSPYLDNQELESNLRRLTENELVLAYLELSEYVRRLERQVDIREELLRRATKSVDAKDRMVKEKEMLIQKLERDFERRSIIDEGPEVRSDSWPVTQAASSVQGKRKTVLL